MALKQAETLYIYVTQRKSQQQNLTNNCTSLAENNHQFKSNKTGRNLAVANEAFTRKSTLATFQNIP